MSNAPVEKGAAETVEGTLDRVVFQNAESLWTVARLTVSASRNVARGGEVTVVGALVGVPAGAALRLRGRWTVNPRYGEQFRVESYQTLTPATVRGIERYLGSGMIEGIGPELAKRIVGKFGMDTLDVIRDKPERLVEVEGIGAKRADRIRAGVKTQREVEDVMVFLQGHGVSTAYAARILKVYGTGAVGIIRRNPYRLALDIWGIGFRTADAIAQRLGIDRRSPERAEAGLLHVLGELVEDGHVHAPEHELLAAAEKALEIDREIVAPALDRLVAAGHFQREDLGDRGPCVSLRALWEAEVRAAAELRRVLKAPAAPVEIDLEKALSWFEQRRGLTLAPRQRQAIGAAVRDKVVVITGGPGTGKTTIVNAILDLLERKGRRIALGAPTGRAAKRLAETTGRSASTLHRLLAFSPQTGGFEKNREAPLEADVVVVDEASMLDVPLAAALFEAVPTTAQLVLVGDVDQLPSVGPGRVLADVIASNVVSVVKLTEIFRQAAASAIVRAAHQVNRGELPDLTAHEGSDFYFIERDEPADVLATVCEVVADRIPRRFGLDPRTEVQVLSPMHRGDVGAQRLNLELQARLNPAREGAPELARGARTFRVGDRVMQIRNDYDKDVFNGDVGRIAELIGGTGLAVDFDGRRVPYEASELDQLVLAYALSVHKSQGSEYPAVVLPLTTQHFLLLQRNLLYTALTRGKRLVVIIGSRKALGIAVRADQTRLRWTWLARRLADGPRQANPGAPL